MSDTHQFTNAELAEHAKNIRRLAMKMSFESKTSHIGCALSFADIITALYFRVANLDPKNPEDPSRDRILLSKGHAVVGLYAALAERGFFPKERLDDYCQDGSRLASHIVYKAVPGAETSAGSGGHGLPIGVGMAVALKNQGKDSRVFVLSGDGELEEGSVWEAAMFGGYHKLANLTLVIDHNHFQDGTSGSNLEQILDLSPLDGKFASFGWETEIIDGHDFDALTAALTKRSDRPRVIIAETIKGKGVSFMERDGVWHNKVPSAEQFAIAMQDLA